MPGSISIIIPTYNYGRYLAEAVESVFGQTFRPTEIIVVDDGSTDETADVILKFGEKVRYIKQSNQGVCVARNRGIAESSSEFIAFMDADDTWEPTKIEKQIAKFAEDNDIGLVHCGMREFDSNTGETVNFHLEGDEGWVADGLLLWEKSVIVGPGGSIIVKRRVIDDIGGFDADLRLGEDWDFCYRVAKSYKVGFVPEALVNYRNHGKNAHKNVSEMELGMSRFYAKAFNTNDSEVLKLRRRAYGNFHRVLAGSYFHSGNYLEFVRHAIKSVMNRPSNLAYFAKFPLRRLKNYQ